MKTILSRLSFVFFFLLGLAASAQTFVGTNSPGLATNYTFNIGAGATNLSLVVSNNASAYSYLLVKHGGTPTDTDFDFAARLVGQTNEINLQSPEFATGSYGLRVSTPAASATQGFRVVLTTNRTDLRSAGYPVSKPLVFSTTGSLTNSGSGAWHYFQVDVPSNLLSGWRIVLSSTNTTTPGLYIRRNHLPTTGSYDKAVGPGQPIDTIIFTSVEATNSTYFIGVYQPSGTASSANYVLSTELASITALTWDPGTTDAGTQVYTNTSLTGGDYYFAITTQNTADQVWRTALNVKTNEADVYALLGSLPSTGSYNYKSARVGSDGFVLAQGPQFSPGQSWYILVHATPGSAWNLVTGEAYVQQLPNLAADASSGATVTMGAEGMHFFKTTISPNTLAWRLWLNGLSNQLYVKQSAAPHPYSTSTYDLTQPGQMLVVPTYLNVGSQYFVGVVGNPGLNFTLDSRQQAVTSMTFNTTSNLTVTGYGYTTYLVQVPVQQIAWQVNVTSSSGNANVAIRRDNVPNEFVNDAFSEPPVGVGASVTLVPPTLSNGSFYLTVYSAGPYTVSLFNGQPVITTVDYVFQITNDAPSRVGWRYYTVVNTAEQLGSLGWELDLSNQVPGAEIAIRRNAVPGQWNYRNNPYDYTGYSSSGYVDFSSTLGFLQQPNHPADVWYIGIYTPASALGKFVLTGSQLTGPPVSFDGVGSTNSVTNQPAGKFKYFTVTVPPTAFGWDLRIVGATNGNPYMYVCRDQLPWSSPPYNYYYWYYQSTWPSQYQIQAGYDWTGYPYDNNGVYRYSQVLEMGMGNALQAGTYYVGVISSTGTSPLNYTLVSRGIGTNFSIPVINLPFTNGVVTTSLVGREAAYYSIVVPTNLPSWRLELSNNVGESLMMLQKDALPNVVAGGQPPYTLYGGRKMQKAGNEQYLLLPVSGQSNIVAGTYYIGVASEGMNPYSSYLGTNSSSFTLHSYGVFGVTNVGTVDNSGLTDIVVTNGNEAGQFGAYQFSVPAGTLSLAVSLESVVGNPVMTLRADNQLPDGTDGYGQDGGQNYSWQNATLINIPNPVATNYTLMVQSVASGGNASYHVRIHALGPLPVTFDGGASNIVNQAVGTWQYFKITVPPTAFGWDLRIVGATNGNPYMYVCRDQAPSQSPPYNYYYWYYQSTWPSQYQIQAGYDWTGYPYDNNGVYRYSQVLEMGMGNALQAGTYYVGVISSTGTSPLNYTLVSRGIGTNFSIPVINLPFTNGVVTTSLVGREAAYYSIVVPTNLPSWRLELSNNVGESLMMLQKDALPNVVAGGQPPYTLYGGRKMQKAGNEQYLLLPVSGQSNIVAGTYYIGVASEGMNPYSSYLGTNSSSFTLHSYGVFGVTNVGTVDNSGLTDIVVTNGNEAGQFGAYQFSVPAGTLSLAVSLESVVGNPVMTLRADNQLPDGTDGYGQDGGQNYSWQNATLINIPNPVATNYTLMVQSVASGGNASYHVRIHALGPLPVTFDGGASNIVNQAVGTWQYFKITVPPTAFGWDLRIVGATNGNPYMYVCRDQAPSQSPPYNYYYWYYQSTWPSQYQIQAGYDWTGYPYDNNGVYRYSQVLEMGMGNALQAGTYYVGVISSTGTSPLNYTLVSRGIGTNFSIPVINLPFTNGVVTTSLVGREAAYYSIVVPTNLPSWRLELSNNVGESLMMLQKDALPNVVAGGQPPYTLYGGRKMQKAGNEQYLLLPVSGQSNIVAGTYYIGVASEGMNPYSSYLGTNSSSFTLHSYGVESVTNFGPVGAIELLSTNSLRGGQNALYQFSVPGGVPAVEVRLDNVTGAPYMTLSTGTNSTSPYNSYGYDGGVSYSWNSPTIITLPNPTATNYSLTVQASTLNGVIVDAISTVHVRQMPTPALAFDASLNAGSISNVATGLLLDGQSAYYQVTVPAMLSGQPVIGWKLDVMQTNGAPSIRVRQNLLPDGNYYDGTSPFNTSEAIMVSPYLTPGTWYVEVKGAGITAYTLKSSSLQLARPAWTMPAVGASVTTIGLPPAGPLFADTGVDTNGLPLQGLEADQGLDLAQGAFDYYAIVVPTNNTGILRTRLDAISGNPNLYIRSGAPSTLSHYQYGNYGATLYDRYLNASGGSEYGNWVPLNGRFETALTNGIWYLAVQAGGNSNVRYRLRMDTGIITNLVLNGGGAINQQMAAGDWLYYAFTIPTNSQVNWNVTFNVQFGSVVMYVRDRVPPGHATTLTDYRDWSSSLDSKNHGPYLSYSSPGTYTLTCPPVRPGNTYYLGFRAVADSTFSLSSSTNGGNIDYTNVIPFINGYTSITIPAFGLMKYRIDVPANATTWKHYSTNASSVWLFLDQGSAPTRTTSDDWYSINAVNSSLNVSLQTSNWPWQPGYSYFLAVTNTSASPQPFVFNMNGQIPLSGPFGFAGISRLGNGSIQVNMYLISGLTYYVQSSSNLLTWAPYSTIVPSMVTNSFLIPPPLTNRVEFFRILGP